MRLAITGFAIETIFGAIFKSGCYGKDPFRGASFLSIGIVVVDLGATFLAAEGALPGIIGMVLFFIII